MSTDVYYVEKRLIKKGWFKQWENLFQNKQLSRDSNNVGGAGEGPRAKGALPEESDEDAAFEIVQINDFAIEQIKSEIQFLEDNGKLATQPICPAYHGGPLDYPKVATKAVAKVVEKWELCYKRLEQVVFDREVKREQSRDQLNSDEEVHEQLTAAAAADGNLRVTTTSENSVNEEEELNEEEFYAAISESASKLCIHNMKLCRKLLLSGDMPSLYSLVGGLALTRNKLWHYNEYIKVPGKPNPFSDQYLELCEMIEATSEQVLEFQCSLVATSILHEPLSQNWSNPKPFYEGERVSYCIQMWWYFLQGLKNDLWSSLPPKTAHRLFCTVFSDSLGILTTRYTSVVPSFRRLPQYQADIASILLICSEVLTVISSSVSKIFYMDPSNEDLTRNTHAKCGLLFTALAVVASPLPMLTKVAGNEAKKKAGGQARQKRKHLMTENDIKIAWMPLMRPDLFTDNVDNMTASAHVILLSKLVVGQPEPSWSLLVQVALCRDMRVAKLILLHFGAFIPAEQKKTARFMTQGCEGFQCQQECLGAADVQWPQAVTSGVLFICSQAMRSPMVLCSVMGPLFQKLSKGSWDALDSSILWNTKKPVWYQGIVEILEPHVHPVMYELFEMIEAGKAWSVSHVPKTIKDILICLQDVVPSIPVSIFHLAKMIQDQLPQEVKPLSKSVITHLLVASFYGVILRIQPVLKRMKMSREKLDFVIAFGEGLCHLSTSVELLQLQNVADGVLAEEVDPKLPERSFDIVTHDFSNTLSEMVSNELLSDENGSHALKCLYRFLCYNVDWIQSSLIGGGGGGGVNPDQDGLIPALLRPWASQIFPTPDPQQMMNQIGALAAEQFECRATSSSSATSAHARYEAEDMNQALYLRFEHVMNLQHNWEAYLQHVFRYGNPCLVSKLWSQRPELNSDEARDEERSVARKVLEAWKKEKEQQLIAIHANG